jgi:glycosyltransferase involved in cell wall biosynthesis
MKIGFDAKRFFHNRTGLGHYSRNLLHSYHQQFGKDELFLYSPTIDSQYADLANKIGIIKTPTTSFKNFWRTMGIKKDLVQEGIQIYHGLSNELPLGIEKTKIKSVVTIHDLLFLHFPNYYKTIDRFIYQKKFSSAAERADIVIAISETTKADLINQFGIKEEKIEIIYPITTFKPPVKLNTISRSSATTIPYLLCISGFEKRKNIERLIEAYIKVNPNYRLIIAGKSGDTAVDCRKLVKSNPKIELYFDLSDKEIEALYGGAMAFVYPSLYEGFGIPVIDAMQYALPIITSKNTSMSEIAGPLGNYFDANNLESMAEQLQLLDKQELIIPNKENIVSQMSKFETDLQNQKMRNLYQLLTLNI